MKKLTQTIAKLALAAGLLLGTGVATWAESVAKVDETAYDDFSIALTAWESGSTLTLLADVETETAITVTGTKTLDLNGYGILMTGGGNVIYVGSESTLILKDSTPTTTHYITLEEWHGTAVSTTGSESPVSSDGSGTLKVTGGYITGGTEQVAQGGMSTSNYNNGGILVESGILTMQGGSIIGNVGLSGGGVTVLIGKYDDDGKPVNGTFDLSNGFISHNKANTGGGVYISNGTTFSMSGGEISYNTAGYAGGVYVNYGAAFTMTGGTIKGNAATNENYGSGGGVYIEWDGTLTMENGTISENRAVMDGGGIMVNSENFTLNGGTISSNTAEMGNNIGLMSWGKITIEGTLGTNKYDVTLMEESYDENTDSLTFVATTGVFTSGLSNKGSLANFTNSDGFALVLTESGEAALASLSASGATLTAQYVIVVEEEEEEEVEVTVEVDSTQTAVSKIADFFKDTGLTATSEVLYGDDSTSTVPTTAGVYAQTVKVTVTQNGTELEDSPFMLTLPRKLLVLSESADNTSAISSAKDETNGVDVRITRTFGANKNTLCLPFALTASEVQAALTGATLYKPKESKAIGSGTTRAKLTTEKVTAAEAGACYIVTLSESASWSAQLFENKTIEATEPSDALSGVTVKGTFSPYALEAGNTKQLFIKEGGTGFTYPKSGDETKLPAFRVWFEQTE